MVALARVREQEDAPAWDTWLAPLSLLHADDDTMVIGAPNCFVRDEVRSAYADLLVQALEDVLGHPVSIEVVVRPSEPSPMAVA